MGETVILQPPLIVGEGKEECKMRHVFILATARTGGTWFGKVFDTGPHVKYLWEPDSHRRPMDERFRQWKHSDSEAMKNRIEWYEGHQTILPAFPKKTITTAVYKLYSVCADVAFVVEEWMDEFLEIREKLDAKVIHILRHPARWAASILRWGDRPLKSSLELYGNDRAFFDRCAGERWYKAIKHEDATMYPTAIFPILFSWCMITYTREFKDFCARMHVEDYKPKPDDHSTVMKKRTVLDRWRGLTPKQIALANDSVREYWTGIYEPLGLGLGRGRHERDE